MAPTWWWLSWHTQVTSGTSPTAGAAAVRFQRSCLASHPSAAVWASCACSSVCFSPWSSCIQASWVCCTVIATAAEMPGSSQSCRLKGQALPDGDVQGEKPDTLRDPS